MKTIVVKDLNEASSKCFNFIDEELKKTSDKLNIALTGGRFGKFFASYITSVSIPIKRLRLFQTDERLVALDNNESIQGMLLEKLMVEENIDTYFFNLEHSPEIIADIMEKSINDLGLKFLDIVILSLGEDGHLAGNFKNSIPLNEKCTFTNNAPKPPKKRISFSIDWLIRSKIVIIVALGNEKEKAIQDLLSGAGAFPSINLSSKNIVLLRD